MYVNYCTTSIILFFIVYKILIYDISIKQVEKTRKKVILHFQQRLLYNQNIVDVNKKVYIYRFNTTFKYWNALFRSRFLINCYT